MAVKLGGDGPPGKKGSSFSENSEINVTPFVDVMLVLLIVFMVAAPLAAVNVKVDMPKSNASADTKANSPVYISLQSSGNVYIADQNFAAVQEIAASSGYSTVSPVGPSSFSEPDAVVIDASGHLFVADFGTGAVYEVAAAGGYNTTSTLISGVGDSNSGSALPLPCDRTGAQWTIRLRVFSQVTARRAVEATQSDIPAGFARATGREGGLWKKLSIFERRPLRSATHAKHKTRSPGAAILPRRPGIIREKP